MPRGTRAWFDRLTTNRDRLTANRDGLTTSEGERVTATRSEGERGGAWRQRPPLGPRRYPFVVSLANHIAVDWGPDR